ncbi:SUN domain-containing protein 1-like protein [Leptotrombidium deliense]|uniref:SUN domain-containing protein 1-like protein n=1 Tax=Leptotrombidium deliense TaxID=299467 RepID=A0A443S3T2_9ACAR|nr:SUN domain-containing protein 1-like protein [Leptotrombidium deliense]
METVKDKLSHLTLELQKVKQEGMVSQENYNSLQASLEDLNKKFNNCCRNETELVSFINANLLLMLSNAQSEEGRIFSTILKNMVKMEMQEFKVPQKEIDDKIDRMVDFVVKRIETLKTEMQESVNELSSKMQNTQTEIKNTKVEVSVDDVKKLIREALFVYDADKTGIPDYALESSGGTVIDIRCSETFDPYGIQYKIFGIPVWSTSNSPRAVIQPTITPGDCWAFKGPQGHLVMKLSKKIVPTSFTYEHISKQISRDGNINSAPREFQVRGLKDENDKEGELLGSYYYEDNGMPLQNFAVTHPNPKPYIYIELVITSNHGHDEYTCLYRFRVHGKPIEY